MSFADSRSSWRHVGVTAIILASLACHTAKLVGTDEAVTSPRVSLTLSDQSVVVMYGPKIYGNKLVGFVNGKYQEFRTADVRALHVRKPDGARTAALVAAGVFGFAGFAWAIAGAGNSKAPNYCDAPEHVDEPICQSQ
jgi:hypothetical protein